MSSAHLAVQVVLIVHPPLNPGDVVLGHCDKVEVPGR